MIERPRIFRGAAITTTDILFKFSVKTGSAGNSTAGTAAGSLGKYISTTQITDATLNNLFDDVTGDENAASDVEYRCFFVHNAHGSLTLTSPVFWLQSEVSGGANSAVATDNIAASAIGSASAQAAEIADEGVAPTGTSAFSAPSTKGSGLSVGNVPNGQCKGLWVRRTATNSAAVANDGVTLRVEGDTAP
jgi:hypothetical protein